MIKKKVLVHGNLNTLKEFFNSPFNRTYEVEAVLTEAPSSSLSIRTGGQEIEVFNPENLPKFIYKFIDGVILTDRQNFQNSISYFLNQGVELFKIILWNNRGVPEFFTAKDKDGSEVVFMEGLQFHIRNEKDLKFFNAIQKFLKMNKHFYTVPPSQYKVMIENMYNNQDRHMDLDNPKTFTEKIQWLKLYDSTPIKTRLADKYLVNQWVAEKIGEQYLIPLLGVWDNFDDIDFDLLPEQFVLKCNHGCGMNIIVRDKSTFDKENAREKINAWLQVNHGALWYELHYNNIKKKIIAEKFLSEGNLPDINNYKFWCFGGKLNFCGFDSGRTAEGSTANLRIDYFDMDWRATEIENGSHPRSENPEKIQKPKNFELMKELAAELCKDLPFVRVDFYEVAGQVYFGEMTFTPGGGLFRYNSVGTDEELGKLVTLPQPYKFKEIFK